MDDLAVSAEPTPNPEAMKFSVNRTVLEGGRGRTFADAAEALVSPLARALFAINGVGSVFMLRDFITVTRKPGADWGPIITAVENVLREHFSGT